MTPKNIPSGKIQWRTEPWIGKQGASFPAPPKPFILSEKATSLFCPKCFFKKDSEAPSKLSWEESHH